MLALVFPGQGSQKKGMGAGLFDAVSEFADIERDIDGILGYSLRSLCLEDKGELLKQTQYTQPALYVVNALHYFQARRVGERPAFLLGHSLGEYNALLAAGVFDFLTGLRLVKKRGELMAAARNGGMAAVIGLGTPRIRELLKQGGFIDVDVANVNSPSQVVISGPVVALDRARQLFEGAGARLYVPLQVSAAFHSRHMADAGRAFDQFLQHYSFAAPRLPVIANVTGEPYPDGDPNRVIRELLVKQISHPVQWTQSVRYALGRGVTTFVEHGPGNVLTRLVQQIRQDQAA